MKATRRYFLDRLCRRFARSRCLSRRSRQQILLGREILLEVRYSSQFEGIWPPPTGPTPDLGRMGIRYGGKHIISRAKEMSQVHSVVSRCIVRRRPRRFTCPSLSSGSRFGFTHQRSLSPRPKEITPHLGTVQLIFCLCSLVKTFRFRSSHQT